ncbi:hypothetical protein KFE25_005804 [Diacronema lutheri]|uniref:Exostosin GT47 domain-containing protein n=1 Tax=Diacronema lutheri TaxID=2081491 RepID=A0A8J6C3V7_DIALT|nr:hypothetical protein KFE25_005804 [Diacronema lutheri]
MGKAELLDDEEDDGALTHIVKGARRVRTRWMLLVAVVALAAVIAGRVFVRVRRGARVKRRSATLTTRRPVRNYLASFEPSCVRERRASECPGYLECVDAMSRSSWRPPNPLLKPVVEPPLCTKEVCLNWTRCHTPFRVYAYTRERVPESLKGCFPAGVPDLRTILPERSRHLVTDDPSEACLYWLELVEKRPHLCHWANLHELPYWHASSGGLPNGGGLNHVLFDIRFEFVTPELRRERLGRAALATTTLWTSRFVPGFDVPVAIGPDNYDAALTSSLVATPPWRRKWLAAFKGSQTHPARRTIATQHDEAAGFIALSLSEGYHQCKTLPPKVKGKTALARRASHIPVERRAAQKGVSLLEADCCDKWRTAYEMYPYRDTQNASFALVIPGHGPQTFRLAEVIRQGTIPVIVGVEQWWLPYGHAPRWEEAALFVPTHVDVHADLLPRLRAIRANATRAAAMQRAALRIYDEWFSGKEAARAAALEVFRRRFEFEGFD